MCRKNHLMGSCAACFGLGLLTGSGLESGLLCLGVGMGLIVFGFSCFRRK